MKAQRPSLLIPVAALVLSLLSAIPADAQSPLNAGVVTASEVFQAIPIATPAFERQGDQDFAEATIHKIVMNDLELSGLFSAPKNPRFAEETNMLDQRDKQIHFAEWSKIGVSYLVKGAYEITGDELSAEVRVYDTIQGNYVYGRRYPKYLKDDPRTLAHRISDDIVERLTGVQGIANTRLAFVRQVDPHGKTKQVCVMDADGHNARALTGQGELTATPAWGARGTEVYYTTYKDFNPDLAGVILRTNKSWFVSRRSGFNLSPAWSEKQQLICLTLTKDGNSELYTMTRGGENARRLTVNRAIDSSPTWSPDGTMLAFTSDRSGTPQIYIMDLQSLRTGRLTYHGNYNDSAVWSPKGDEIAFCSRVDGEFQICIVNIDGTNLRQITTGNSSNEDPCWAPNGKVLAFTSNRKGPRQIYTMLVNGANVRQLTSGVPCLSPSWSPAPPAATAGDTQ